MITSSGPRCDVCWNHILLDRECNPFSVIGINRELHCHDHCKQKLIDCGNKWESLPNGPLRILFEKAANKPNTKEHEKMDLENENK